MEALILAAGEGTRLLPLTQRRPKPLFPILNQPLLHLTLAYLHQFTTHRVILNTHHLADQINEFVQAEKGMWPFEINTRFEPTILGTGGGIGNTRDFWKSDLFLVINSDIVTNIDLRPALEFHRKHAGPVTLILHDYPKFNQISVDPEGRIRDFGHKTGKGLAFTGIHLLNREIFNLFPPAGIYDIIPIYQKMIHQGIPIWAHITKGHYWRDIGTPRSYLQIHKELLAGDLNLGHNFFDMRRQEGDRRVLAHPETRIEKGVEFSGWACIGKGCFLKSGCRIHNSVIWEDVVVEPGISISESILGQGVHVKQDLQAEVLI